MRWPLRLGCLTAAKRVPGGQVVFGPGAGRADGCTCAREVWWQDRRPPQRLRAKHRCGPACLLLASPRTEPTGGWQGEEAAACRKRPTRCSVPRLSVPGNFRASAASLSRHHHASSWTQQLQLLNLPPILGLLATPLSPPRAGIGMRPVSARCGRLQRGSRACAGQPEHTVNTANRAPASTVPPDPRLRRRRRGRWDVPI
jgi:hypothetical protein